MSHLQNNDLALILNRRVLSNLAVSMDLRSRASIEAGVAQLEALAALGPQVTAMLDLVEHPSEVVGNLSFPIPRTLYATSAPFSVAPGADDFGTLLNRINRYDDPSVATGPADVTIPQDVLGPGLPPCPISFWRDKLARRFTFVRDFFSAAAPPTIEVVNNGVDVTISGTAARGQFFSRRAATNAPTHEFTMKLRYTLNYVMPDENAVHLGSVPFKVTKAPTKPSPLTPIPAIGQVIYALPRRDASGAVIPGQFEFPPASATRDDLAGGFFFGRAGDLVFDTGTDSVHFFVDVDETRPQRLVLREIVDFAAGEAVAEGVAGRVELRFDSMVELDMQPLGPNQSAIKGSDPQGKAIGNSLIKIQPSLFRGLTCGGDPSALPGGENNLNLLRLLGPTGLNMPLLPRSPIVSNNPFVVSSQDVANGVPGPVGSVRSSLIECDLTFPLCFPQNQSLGMAGVASGGQGSGFDDFSAGSDMAVGVGQVFQQPVLDRMVEDVKAKILADPPDGMTSVGPVGGSLVQGGALIKVHIDGEVETPWPFPNIGWEVDASITVGFRTQRAVVVNGDGAPVDAFGCPIPATALAKLGLDRAAGQLTPTNAPVSSNPLCFLAFWDPGNGVACFDNCPPPVRLRPPLVDANASPIVGPACAGAGADDPQRFAEASFGLAVNAGLRPQFEVLVTPPGEDDVEVETSYDFWAVIAIGLTGLFLAPLIPFGGVELAVVALTGLMLLPFVNIAAGAIATDLLQQKLAHQNLPSFDLDLNDSPVVGVFLMDPSDLPPADPPFEVGSAAMFNRYRVVVRAA